ncbi:MAG: chloride channel protein [Chitinispirillaceae bacterium]|nr:chloride channel protein [Chitinispirillaceae bacterium]
MKRPERLNDNDPGGRISLMHLLSERLKSTPENIRTSVTTVVSSLCAGLAAVAFLLLTNLLFTKTFVALTALPKITFVVGSFFLIVISSLIVGLVLKFNPDAAGSGIPQIKTAYWKELGHMRWQPVVTKFFGGIISLGCGASLGREGPTVYLCSGVTSLFSGLFGYPKRARRSSLVIGAASGLAAAFNTPLAAITFILEEIIGDLNCRFMGSVVIASVTGAIVVHASIGRQPAFTLPGISGASWHHYLLVPIVAMVATGAGIMFEQGALRLRGYHKNRRTAPVWLLPLFGGLLTWCIGVGAYLATGKIGVFGLGYHDLSMALTHGIEWKIAGLLLLAKVAATIFSYGFGGLGGIFSPTLFIGGMAGFFIAGLFDIWMPLTTADHMVLATVGMCSCLGAVIRAPLTSMLIVFEMTHEFTVVPGLMIGVVLSQAIVRRFGSHNFYDRLLMQDGHELVKIKPPRDLLSWQNLQVGQLVSSRAVIIDMLDKEKAAGALASSPYRCFPVLEQGTLAGIVSRERLTEFLRNGTVPVMDKPVTCHPRQTIREVCDKFIESPSGVMAVIDPHTGRFIGIITLHDLLRAQAAALD